ncbi:MAG: hypothetical protein H6R35_726 [Bacteroidetes bacterium]|nr:hypothetical protein [Bacteroidota bacterium]
MIIRFMNSLPYISPLCVAKRGNLLIYSALSSLSKNWRGGWGVSSCYKNLKIHSMNGRKQTRNNITETAMSYVINCLPVSGCLR